MKIHCPNHEDQNASLHVYEEYSYCFVCGYRVSNNQLGVYGETTRKEPEDIKTTLEYIQNLPTKWVRGLELSYDIDGYYIFWPSRDYYKKRYFKGEQRYSGPKGIRQPLFKYPGSKSWIVVIEGELNALSIWRNSGSIVHCPTICSPGAVSNLSRFMQDYSAYKKITLIVDHDAAGVAYGVDTKEKLLKMGKNVTLVTVDTDYNQVLQQLGAKALIKQFRKDVGL